MDLNLEPVPENPAKKKQIAMIVAGVAVLMLLVAGVTRHWLYAEAGDNSAGFGLWGFKMCRGDECMKLGTREYVKKHNELVDGISRYRSMDPDSDPRDALGMVGASKMPERKGPAFWLAGYATMLFMLGAAAMLITAVVLINQGRFFLGSVAPTSLAFLFIFLGLIAGCVFVATNPTRGMNPQLGVGFSFWLFGIGSVAGIVAAQMLAKFKPADPGWAAY